MQRKAALSRVNKIDRTTYALREESMDLAMARNPLALKNGGGNNCLEFHERVLQALYI